MDDDMLRVHHALILLLLAVPAYAETVNIDGENNVSTWQNNSGTTCDSAACENEVNDGLNTTRACDSSAAAGPTCILFNLGTPSANPTTGTDAQTIEVRAHEHDDSNNGTNCDANDGTGNPTLTIELYCNGTASGVTVISAVSFSGTSPGAYSNSGTFTFGTTIGTATCAADGSDLQLNACSTRGSGTPAQRRWAAITQLWWDATVSSGGRTRRTF